MKWVNKSIDCATYFETNGLISFSEFNVLQPSPLNEKVLREKRKKLKETFDRVMRLYVSVESKIPGLTN